MKEAVEYKAKGCTFLVNGNKIFVKTNLQLFILTAPRSPNYIRQIREHIENDQVTCIGDLYNLMKHRDENYLVVDMIAAQESWYV